MIKTETAYKSALARINADRQHLEAKRAALIGEGLSIDQIERVLEPEVSFHEQLLEEIEWYESVSRGDLQAVTSLQHLGRLLIGLRIASRLSQRDLAALLDVHESLVSRDERNEYYGITIQRAQEIIDVLKGKIKVVVQPPQKERELVLA